MTTTTTTPTTTYTATFTAGRHPETRTVSAPAGWSEDRVTRTMRLTIAAKGVISLEAAEEVPETIDLKLGE